MGGLFSKSLVSKIQNLACFKTKFGPFQLQAPGNPESYTVNSGDILTKTRLSPTSHI